MVEMYADGDVRIDFRYRIHHVLQHDVICVRSGATGGLDYDRRIDSAGRCHDGERLLHAVDVESGDAVAVLSGMLEELAERDACHWRSYLSLRAERYVKNRG